MYRAAVLASALDFVPFCSHKRCEDPIRPGGVHDRPLAPDGTVRAAPASRGPVEAAERARREAEEIGLKPLLEAGRLRGRGAVSNPDGRYEPTQRAPCDDGWGTLDEPPPLATEVTFEKARTIITRNDSPDISFDRSINPYRGCEHGCIYCFARPTHAYQGLSPGLDFETKLFAKPNAAELLEKELSAPGYRPRTIAMGTNTDPYQPIERKFRITRGILNHVYFENRSFSSSGSRRSLVQRRSATTKGSWFRRASKSATRRVRSSAQAWQW